MAETTRKTSRRGRIGLIALAAIALLLGVGWQYVKPSYSSVFMDASWSVGTDPKDARVAGRILNWNGAPAAGQAVEIDGDAGTVSATTDDAGRFASTGKHLRRLSVVGVDEIPLSTANLHRDGAVTFEIHLKRPPPPSKGPL